MKLHSVEIEAGFPITVDDVVHVDNGDIIGDYKVKAIATDALSIEVLVELDFERQTEVWIDVWGIEW
jgi:hypothetical protein